MSQAADYDTDILEWSEQQASALRDLARTRHDLSNVIDWEHVAEEIEDVGRSQFVAVQSLIRQIFIHLIKAVSLPDAISMLHWRKEVGAFHGDLLDRITPSMRSRLDVDKIWQRALRQAELDLAASGAAVLPALPRQCPLDVADIVDSEFDLLRAVEILRERINP
jgi:Domain of unknown function DUF29